MKANRNTADRQSTGTLLSELVNRVSHGSGDTLRVMSSAHVTLQQVLVLTRLRQMGPSSASDLALRMGLSLPAISQAADRLVRLKLITRVEDSVDRRKKQLATTAKATALLDRLTMARAHEYGEALSALPTALIERLRQVLEEAVHQFR